MSKLRSILQTKLSPTSRTRTANSVQVAIQPKLSQLESSRAPRNIRIELRDHSIKKISFPYSR